MPPASEVTLPPDLLAEPAVPAMESHEPYAQTNTALDDEIDLVRAAAPGNDGRGKRYGTAGQGWAEIRDSIPRCGSCWQGVLGGASRLGGTHSRPMPEAGWSADASR